MTILVVGHFAGTGAFSLACMYLVQQDVAASWLISLSLWLLHVLACLHVLGIAKCGSLWTLHLLLHVSLPPRLYFSHPFIVFLVSDRCLVAHGWEVLIYQAWGHKSI